MKVNSPLKNTLIALSRLRLDFRRFFSSLQDDIGRWRGQKDAKLTSSGKKVDEGGGRATIEVKPQIFISYATDNFLRGSHKFSGGEKLLNNLTLLLRRHGYEAWMISTDGKHDSWLVEHAPFLSIEEFRKRLASVQNYRCVTSWIPAKIFLKHCPHYYFWDQELAASSRSHFSDLTREMVRGRIIQTAGVNRAVQAWHRTMFDRDPLVLRQLIDEHHWKPNEGQRITLRIGYFDEGEHTENFINIIRKHTESAGLQLEFFQLKGVESEIITQMQTCGVFLALNIGKSPWGEGGPMSPQEAMACGTVPICFDINGPWELIVQNYNGIICREITPKAMVEALLWIYKNNHLSEMSRRCLEITYEAHTMEARWPDVKKFLDLLE